MNLPKYKRASQVAQWKESSCLAWKIPEEPGGQQSTGLQRVRDDLLTKQQQKYIKTLVFLNY